MSSSLILSAVAGSVLLCAVLAAYGFKGRVTTIGVDLGTTFSVVGVHVDGQVRIVSDKQGNNIFPSVVSYLPNGEVAVGYAAVKLLSARPADTVFNSKRFLGRSLAEPDVQAYAAAHPFELAEVGAEVTPYGQVGIRLSPAASGHPPVLSPESVGTKVLQVCGCSVLCKEWCVMLRTIYSPPRYPVLPPSPLPPLCSPPSTC